MIDPRKRENIAAQKANVRRRVYAEIDPTQYEFIPPKKQIDYYDDDVPQRIAVYARVSTDHVQQTSSYELQKKYYEEFVVRHPNWTLVKIYADEGISGTSLAHRSEFVKMIADCRAGSIDMIITKSVSRFARNVVDCISMVRTLAELTHPVGVFFESECIFSLRDDSQMALSFQATMAQEESHIRSRSMETSLRMRLDGGLPLTPKLLGYSHDTDGNLVINPDEQPTVKLIFYMYLYGYSTAEIAETLTALGKKTYLGNLCWTSGSVVQVLRNERHCGDVLTRKTFTPNYLNHKSRKNRGDRPQSIYRNHHTAIVSRDDYIAVQHLLNNAKYGNKSILPELRVIDSGILRGYVTINPRWAGFKAPDYFRAAASLYPSGGGQAPATSAQQEPPVPVCVEAGDFDMRGFEITRAAFFDSHDRPYVTFQDKQIQFSTSCVRKLGKQNLVELLVNPLTMQFAVRTKDSRHAVVCSRLSNGIYYPKEISCAAFMDTLYQIFGWNRDFKYRVCGTLVQGSSEAVYLFYIREAEAFIRPHLLAGNPGANIPPEACKPFSVSGARVRAVPQAWVNSFGKPYYQHPHTATSVESQSEDDWTIRLEGQLFEAGEKLRVTGFDQMKAYITQALSSSKLEEATYE